MEKEMNNDPGCTCHGIEWSFSCFEFCSRSKPEDCDLTPWCSGCGAKKRENCHCGPISDNE